MAALWSIVWLSSVGESPAKDVHIDEEERDYIIRAIGPTTVQRGEPNQHFSREFLK